jgi:PAS domain S-box-containing protein
MVGAAYFGAAKLGLLFAFSNSSVTAVWPPSGLALAAVLVYGPSVLPGIWIGAFVANLTTQGSVAAVCGIATGNTLEPWLGAYLLSQVNFNRSLQRIRDVVALIVLAGGLSTLASATIGVASLAADGLVAHGSFFSTWRTWWLGDLGGDVLVASLLLVFISGARPPGRRLWQTEAVILAAALAAVGALALSGSEVRVYAVLPLLMWAALRFGQPGAVLGGLVVAALAVWFTTRSQGPFAGRGLDSALLRSQTFVGIATVTSLLVAAVRSEQRDAEEAQANLRDVLDTQRRQAEALREAEERFRGAFDNAPIGMALVAPDGRWLRVNRAVSEIVGYDEHEMLQRNFRDITHPDDLEADLEAVSRMLSGEIRSYQIDKRYIHRDGRIVWITLSVSLVHDRDGEPLYFVTQIENITGRKRTQMALQAAVEIVRAVAGETELDRVLELIAERSRGLVDASGLAILMWDEGEFVLAAAAGELPRALVGTRLAPGSIAERVRVTGRAERHDLRRGESRFGLGPLGVSADSMLAVPLVFRGRTLGVIEALDRAAGPEFGDEDEWLLLAAAASAGTAIATAQSVGRDRLRMSLRAAEAERRRWARELHDETLQALAGLRVLLSSAQRSSDGQLLHETAENALEQLDTEIENLRVLISELRPAALDELGLHAALVALAERTRVRHGIEVKTTLELNADADTPAALDPELEVVIYRVIQEALTNAARHGNPESVEVRLGHSDGQVHVSISDDGSGFDPTRPTHGFGLSGMRERVSLVGGRFELSSSTRGTTIAIDLPATGRFPSASALSPSR